MISNANFLKKFPKKTEKTPLKNIETIQKSDNDSQIYYTKPPKKFSNKFEDDYFTNKKQKHNSASRGRSHKIIKEQNNNENKEKLLNKIEKKMNSHLFKYNISENEYNKKVINDIIYDEKKHIVSILKDYIFDNSGNDFLQRFYYKHESINRLPKIK